MENKSIGSSFDDFLEQNDLLEECTAAALKRVIAWQINESMQLMHLTKSQLAEEMHTSRSSLDRLLDPANTSLSLKTLANAANAMGKQVQISLVDAPHDGPTEHCA